MVLRVRRRVRQRLPQPRSTIRRSTFDELSTSPPSPPANHYRRLLSPGTRSRNVRTSEPGGCKGHSSNGLPLMRYCSERADTHERAAHAYRFDVTFPCWEVRDP